VNRAPKGRGPGGLRYRAFLLPALSALAPIAALAPISAHGDERTLRRVVYDYAVTSYCGLLTVEVEYGFKRELSALTEASQLTEEEAKAQRIAGWVDADREWSNRGLGGYRAWCEEEGLPAARRFLEIAQQP